MYFLEKIDFNLISLQIIYSKIAGSFDISWISYCTLVVICSTGHSGDGSQLFLCFPCLRRFALNKVSKLQKWLNHQCFWASGPKDCFNFFLSISGLQHNGKRLNLQFMLVLNIIFLIIFFVYGCVCVWVFVFEWKEKLIKIKALPCYFLHCIYFVIYLHQTLI